MYSSRRYCACVNGSEDCNCRYIRLVTYTSYWCYNRADSSSTAKRSGLRYGGFYTSTLSNPMTETHGCPGGFYPLHIGLDIKVCVGEYPHTEIDIQAGKQEELDISKPFAGFISCQAGNPLLFKEPNARGSLESYVESQPPSAWPRRCPLGYSQHLVTIEDDCEISVCTRSTNRQALKIKQPPFQRPPQLVSMSTLQPATEAWEEDFIIMDGKRWTHEGRQLIPESDIIFKQQNQTAAAENLGQQGGLQGGQIAGISVGVTLLLATMVLLLVLGIKRRHSRPASNANRNGELICDGPFQGQATNGEQDL